MIKTRPDSDLDDRQQPRYHQIAGQLREEIVAGALAPGSRLPSYSQMRLQHGVSQSILERAHAVLQKEGLIERRERSGIFVAEPTGGNLNGREVTQRRGTIALAGLQSWHASSPYYLHLMAGIQEVLAPAAINFMVVNNDADSATAWEAIDGLLICESKPSHFRQLIRYRPYGMPCVSLLVKSQSADDIASVSIDDREAIRTATRYLQSLGHQRIAYLRGRADLITRERVQGYLEAMNEAGIEPPRSWIRRMHVPSGSAERKRMNIASRTAHTMQRWLRSDWFENNCTALLVHNDEAAQAAIAVLNEFDLSVPRDVSVFGFDGLPNAGDDKPVLTTIEVPLREIGRRGAERLLAAFEGTAEPVGTIQLKAALRVGATTRRLTTG